MVSLGVLGTFRRQLTLVSISCTRSFSSRRLPANTLAFARCARVTGGKRVSLIFRQYSIHSPENVNVEHAQWLSGDGHGNGKIVPGLDMHGEDFDDVADGKGKLSPTTSHLFKLIIPLDVLAARFHVPPVEPPRNPVPTVFLLHPSQPMSHVTRLIAASLPDRSLDITFLCTSPSGRLLQWSDSTDVGDFVRDAARAEEFTVQFTRKTEDGQTEEHALMIDVPSFADRTRFLRQRLQSISKELKSMEGLKRSCDKEAHRGAKRVAIGGLGMLVVYWGAVARLTFWDFGWDVMEPITYLSGLSTVILGYLWFLYQGREVSYTSVLDSSILTRRQALYKQRGFDIDRWNDLLAEERHLRAEISQIARDYDRGTSSESDGSEGKRERDDRAEESGMSPGEKLAENKDPSDVSRLSAQDRTVMDGKDM